jgi:hypothetical protein
MSRRSGSIARVITVLFAAACGSEMTAPADPVPAAGGPSRGIAVGSVHDGSGRSIAGANVYVGTFRSNASGSCSSFAGARTVERGVSDGNGRFRVAIPDATPADSIACAFIYVEVLNTGAQVGEPASATAGPQLVRLPATAHDSIVFDANATAVSGSPGPREPDDAWARAAQTTAPGWAGMFFEGCKVVMQLTDPSTQTNAARAYASAQLAGNPSCGGAFQYEARKVTYDFAQLRRWYDRIQMLTAIDGWRSTDIDEVRNVIALGYASAAGVDAAKHALASLDVPAAAASFAVVNGAIVRTISDRHD